MTTSDHVANVTQAPPYTNNAQPDRHSFPENSAALSSPPRYHSSNQDYNVAGFTLPPVDESNKLASIATIECGLRSPPSSSIPAIPAAIDDQKSATDGSLLQNNRIASSITQANSYSSPLSQYQPDVTLVACPIDEHEPTRANHDIAHLCEREHNLHSADYYLTQNMPAAEGTVSFEKPQYTATSSFTVSNITAESMQSALLMESLIADSFEARLQDAASTRSREPPPGGYCSETHEVSSYRRNCTLQHSYSNHR